MTGPSPSRSRTVAKAETAFRTIGEVSIELGVPQHVLRYWEGRFPQLKPLQRAGNRRYYRPDDMALLRRIQDLLDREGYTIRGVQKLLSDRTDPDRSPASEPEPEPEPSMIATSLPSALLGELRLIRSALRDALRDDSAS